MDEILKYVQIIGKILSIGISLYAIVWAIISLVKVYVEKMKLAIENKDWEGMINIVNEFVLAAEEKFLGKTGTGAEKKAMVISLLEKAGYEVTEVIDALIESAVYQQFNYNREKK
jgi:hypothetical protein